MPSNPCAWPPCWIFPVVDADAMGRAFPAVFHTSFAVGALTCAPFSAVGHPQQRHGDHGGGGLDVGRAHQPPGLHGTGLARRSPAKPRAPAARSRTGASWAASPKPCASASTVRQAQQRPRGPDCRRARPRRRQAPVPGQGRGRQTPHDRQLPARQRPFRGPGRRPGQPLPRSSSKTSFWSAGTTARCG